MLVNFQKNKYNIMRFQQLETIELHHILQTLIRDICTYIFSTGAYFGGRLKTYIPVHGKMNTTSSSLPSGKGNCINITVQFIVWYIRTYIFNKSIIGSRLNFIFLFIHQTSPPIVVSSHYKEQGKPQVRGVCCNRRLMSHGTGKIGSLKPACFIPRFVITGIFHTE